ncbi:MAG TPA: thioredoxin-disulfide reductase [Acidobacteriota bacterium]|nr:thioredoxin-disulfide reductase [Acidobacteriota bacterium]HRV08636.1 thioredoxin-disulfide reductase [Acidobacteriota bacterium]
MVYNTIILGSGCAGSTAAVYAARAGLNPVVLEGHEPGGQLSLTTLVENFPGFPDGVQGPELVERMKRQAQKFGAEYRMERATAADLKRTPFVVQGDSERYETHSLIIATGASARFLGLESERQLIGHGVSTCATCDGFFFRNQKVVVVGGGDTAMEEALYLAQLAESVTVIHRRDQLRASPLLARRAMEHQKIRFIWDSVVVDILDPAKKAVEAVKVRNVKTQEEKLVPADGVFIAIGHQPNTAIFRGQLELLESGYIAVKNGTRTSVEGVFAAGDVADSVYRQAVTAAGSGCRAALDCHRYLQENGVVS